MFPRRLWVKAEVGQISMPATGHCYLELVQNSSKNTVAKARAVIWRTKYALIMPFFEAVTGSALKAGMQVLLRVQVTFSEMYGATLVVDQIDPEYTIGQKELERIQTIKRLTEEGLIEKQKDLALERLPYHFAVISSETAAGYGDFIRHLTENPYGFVFKTDLYNAAMQGDDCPPSVVSAINAVVASGIQYDAVLLLRGGGSEMDLCCFDDYKMASAIANCPLPVLTAIGHDRDFHVADMVAFESVKTPTALADFFVSIYKAEDDMLLALDRRISGALSGRISSMEGKLESVIQRIMNVCFLKIEKASGSISLLESRIKSADPREIIRRGYTLATDSSGVVLKSAEGIEVGDSLSVRFFDGVVDCNVKLKRK
ncbi:MAG: exodeoxyribonuclease VII large subunit [Bacteroidales bacterium]|nr:exodeoxyribonuclease VII large subunit [Bacteroidales bacterium]